MGENRLELSPQKTVSLIAMLFIFLEAVFFFWMGIDKLLFTLVEFILVGLLFFALLATIIDLKSEKLAFLKKIYHWLFILIVGLVVLLFELIHNNMDIMRLLNGGFLLASILTILAAILELLAEKKESINPTKVVLLLGVVWAVIEGVVLFINVSQGTPAAVGDAAYNLNQATYYGVIAIICAVLLLLVLQDKINVKLKLDWWLVLIVGFVMYQWVEPGVAGTFIMIGFILMIMK
jgi:hypothetical protein